MCVVPRSRFGSPRQKILFFSCVTVALLIFFTFQVAIHSVVENLFRSIWSLPNNKAPVAIKYFFDFLDAQAESKKITDPDVVHIWKTNRYIRVMGTGVHAVCKSLVAEMEQVACDQKNQILLCQGEGVVWPCGPPQF